MATKFKSFRFTRHEYSRLLKILAIAVVVLIGVFVFMLGTRKSNHASSRVKSMANIHQIVGAVYQYESEFLAYPTDLSVMKLEGFIRGSDGSLNPREGFSSYHFDAPDVPLDEIEDPANLAVIFEVRDDGTIMRDSGVIGYADGRVEYHPEEE